MSTEGFDAFPPTLLPFLSDLSNNNNRDWFKAHRATYEAAWRRPGEAFAGQLAAAVSARQDQPCRAKVFRIHRDVRFSKDKRPYKTHLHIAILPEDGPDEMGGWFFGVEPGKLTLGAGRFGFDQDGLERFRIRVAGEDGDALADILSRLQGEGVRMSEPELKRAPKGVAPDDPRADLLRRKSLTVWIDEPDPRRIEQLGLIAHCIDRFALFAPVMDWLEKG